MKECALSIPSFRVSAVVFGLPFVLRLLWMHIPWLLQRFCVSSPSPYSRSAIFHDETFHVVCNTLYALQYVQCLFLCSDAHISTCTHKP